LVGHERGAFTDAKDRRIGLVEAANGGTLFLDEIGDIEPPVQLRLLKLIEDRTVRRVGGVRDRTVDVRFVSATNRPLEELVRAGKFRSDLYYRLRVVTIDVPALRSRHGDAELLARHFLALHGRRYGRQTIGFSPRAVDRIRDHVWPGNVRELRNVIEQALLSADGEIIDEAHLGIAPTELLEAVPVLPLVASDVADLAPGGDATLLPGTTLMDTERTLISRALA